MQPDHVEVVEDLTAQSRCEHGFLTLRRLRLRSVFPDGSRSEPYPCDIVSRPGVDAVAALPWYRGPDGRPKVILKSGLRPPVWLRRSLDLIQPDPEAPLILIELIAGLLEEGDEGSRGPDRRAALEAREEAGLQIEPESFRELGAAMFSSPGTADEKVEFRWASLEAEPELHASFGDGTPMEAGTEACILDLQEAIARCRDGRIPDMKTEIGLLRLADRIGWLPSLDCWLEALPESVRRRAVRAEGHG